MSVATDQNDLLFLLENAELDKSDIVKVCGYTSVKKDGSIKLNYIEFYQALLSVTS